MYKFIVIFKYNFDLIDYIICFYIKQVYTKLTTLDATEDVSRKKKSNKIVADFYDKFLFYLINKQYTYDWNDPNIVHD